MFFSDGYLSVTNAQVVANGIHDFIKTNQGGHFVLHVTDSTESELIELQLRPTELFENANGTEMVQCMTSDGDPITIVLPNPKDRQTSMALVLFPEQGLSR